MNLYEDAAQNWAEDEAREEIRFFQDNLADGHCREKSLEILARGMAKMKTVFEINSFDTKTSADNLHVLTVTSTHVRQECIFLNAEAENKWRHQYIMYILNGSGEVIPVMSSIHQEKSVCMEQLSKIEKILNGMKEKKKEKEGVRKRNDLILWLDL